MISTWRTKLNLSDFFPANFHFYFPRWWHNKYRIWPVFKERVNWRGKSQTSSRKYLFQIARRCNAYCIWPILKGRVDWRKGISDFIWKMLFSDHQKMMRCSQILKEGRKSREHGFIKILVPSNGTGIFCSEIVVFCQLLSSDFSATNIAVNFILIVKIFHKMKQRRWYFIYEFSSNFIIF